MHVFRILPFVIAAFSCTLTANSGIADGNVDLPRFPSISPDGETVVFSWRGDIWSAPIAGGDSRRLTSHPGRDHRSAWVPDGNLIIFESDRDGVRNMYSMKPDGTSITKITDTDASLFLSNVGVDADGEYQIALTGYLEGDVYRDSRPYEVSLKGGQPRRMHDAFGRNAVRSPDGSKVAFVRGGSSWSRRHYRGPDDRDVWVHRPAEDSFVQLTTWEGNDGLPRWSGEDQVLYLSDREGDTVNLYRHDLDAGEDGAEALTAFEERDVMAFDITPDGRTAIIHRWDTLYSLDLNDPEATPIPIVLYASEDELDSEELVSVGRKVTEAARNPDGKSIAMVAYGDVYVRGTEKSAKGRRVFSSPGREKDLTWSPDGSQLYFVSDVDGTESIMVAHVLQTRTELKDAYTEVTSPEEEPEADDESEVEDEEGSEQEENSADPVSGTWSCEANIPQAGPSEITIELTLAEDGSVTGEFSAADFSGTFSGEFDSTSGILTGVCTVFGRMSAQLEVTITDGSLRGSVILGEGGGVFPITGTHSGIDVDTADAAEEKEDITEEEESEEDGEEDGEEDSEEDSEEEADEEEDPADDPARWAEALTFMVEPFLETEFNDHYPVISPDGVHLAFTRGNGMLMIMDLATNETRLLREGWDSGLEYRFTPDGRWVVFDQADRNFNQDIFIVPVDGSAHPINITRHPDNDGSPRIRSDGKSLAFRSERKDEEFDVWYVFLDESLERMSSEEQDEYFKKNATAAKKKSLPKAADIRKNLEEIRAGEVEEDEDYEAPFTTEDLQDAYLRLRRLTSLPGSESNIEMIPSGETVVFTYSGGSPGSSGLYSVKFDGSGRKELGDTASILEISTDGSKLTAVSGGQAKLIDPSSGKAETMGISDRVRINLEDQSTAKFNEAARILSEWFYHPEMKGLDWSKLTEDYRVLATRARTADEFNWVAGRLLGELNASHLGIRAPSDSMPLSQSLGRLGTIHEPVKGGFLVTDIIEDSAAERTTMPLQVEDVITGIEFEPFDPDSVPTEELESRLRGMTGKEVVVSVRRRVVVDGAEGEEGEDVELDLLISPQSWSSLRSLIYKRMQQRNADLVDAWSGGRLGYAHVRGMSQPSLDEFERDLFAATEGRDGLIVDVRNNGGGWTADRMLASLMSQPHAYTVPRGADPSFTEGYPQDRLFIQRCILPVNMLCNEKSFSNAEIVSHAFKGLDRGNLVGQQTYGGVISTGGTSLIDGTTVRHPFRGWYLPDGTDMENNGAMPDLVVLQTPEDESRNHDAQLKAAVDDLLSRMDQD